jgi:hypothetical protein
MLKEAASFVLAPFRPSTYPEWRTSCLGSLGWVGEKCNASGFDSAEALLDDPFEHPARKSSGTYSGIASTH